MISAFNSIALSNATAPARSLKDAEGFLPSSLIYKFFKPSSFSALFILYIGVQPILSGIKFSLLLTGNKSRYRQILKFLFSLNKSRFIFFLSFKKSSFNNKLLPQTSQIYLNLSIEYSLLQLTQV